MTKQIKRQPPTGLARFDASAMTRHLVGCEGWIASARTTFAEWIYDQAHLRHRRREEGAEGVEVKTLRWNFRVEITIDQPGYGYTQEPDARFRRSSSWQANSEDVLRQVQRHIDVPRRDANVAWDDVCPWCLNTNGFEPDVTGQPQCCDQAINAWETEQAAARKEVGE